MKRKSPILKDINPDLPPGSVLKDVDIRFAFHEQLRSDPNIWFRDEVGFHGAIADILVVTPDDVHVYEIKSDADTLSRLATKLIETKTRKGKIKHQWQWGQVECYSKAADKVTLIVGTKLFAESLTQIPEWWGVILAESVGSGICFKEVRDALPNPGLTWKHVYDLLWRDEALDLAAKVRAKGVVGKSKAVIAKAVEPLCDLPELRKFIRETIPRRIWTKFRKKIKGRGRTRRRH